MSPAIRLIYLGILKFGFKDDRRVSIVGLIDYMLKNKLELEEEPTISINRTYTVKSDEVFWELEWHNSDSGDQRYLVVYFDSKGCHYQRFFTTGSIEGDIQRYEEFMEQYKWLAGG